jgi:hypothetical protein
MPTYAERRDDFVRRTVIRNLIEEDEPNLRTLRDMNRLMRQMVDEVHPEIMRNNEMVDDVVRLVIEAEEEIDYDIRIMRWRNEDFRAWFTQHMADAMALRESASRRFKQLVEAEIQLFWLELGLDPDEDELVLPDNIMCS